MNITPKMAHEFTRDYLGTLKTKGMENTFRSVKSIAQIMGIDFDKAVRFVVMAKANGFMYDDNQPMPSYINFPALFKVWEDHV
jgi:hypothetical protein